MTSQAVALRNHAYQNGVPACNTRTVKALICRATRSKWCLLLTIAVGTLLTIVAVKLVALFGAAVNVSFLRDVGGNGTPWATVGGIGAGISHFFSGGYPPNLPPNLAGPGQYGPYGNPWSGTDHQGIPYSGRYVGTRNDGTVGPVTPSHFTDPATGQNYMNSAGAMIWFSQGVQAAATAIIGKDGTPSSGNAGGKA